ncbi:unnamed protein product [Camellia sinensis]
MLLKSLKILNLSHSHQLTNTLDFSNILNLERLILEDCTRLLKAHESIRELRGLILLNLEDCKSLRKLPQQIGHLKALKELILSSCSKLNQFPTELGNLESLTAFNADKTNIYPSVSTNGDKKLWSSLFLSRILRSKRCPNSISFSLGSFSRSLVSLSLAQYNLSNDGIPRDIGGMSLLQDLNLSENPICSILDSIKCLTLLQSLALVSCSRLQSLLELPMSLNDLDLFEYRSLEIITNLPNMLSSLGTV